MATIEIKTTNSNLIRTAQILKIKAEIDSIGIKFFPTELFEELCPFKNYAQKKKWVSRIQQMWNHRANDEDKIKYFEKALEMIKEIEVNT